MVLTCCLCDAILCLKNIDKLPTVEDINKINILTKDGTSEDMLIHINSIFNMMVSKECSAEAVKKIAANAKKIYDLDDVLEISPNCIAFVWSVYKIFNVL